MTYRYVTAGALTGAGQAAELPALLEVLVEPLEPLAFEEPAELDEPDALPLSEDFPEELSDEPEDPSPLFSPPDFPAVLLLEADPRLSFR